MKAADARRLRVGGRQIVFRIRDAPAARHLRVRIGPTGVEVVRPPRRSLKDVRHFLREHREWVLAQVARIEALPSIRAAVSAPGSEILLRGVRTPVKVLPAGGARYHRVEVWGGEIVLFKSSSASTSPARALEGWLRREARADVVAVLQDVAPRSPRAQRLYIMNQRTKWGNCSRRGNLSFSWRLVMAPAFVLRYVVLHEVTHLSIPSHSADFWLVLRGRCPDLERAKRWLALHGAYLPSSLDGVLGVWCHRDARSGVELLGTLLGGDSTPSL